MNDSSKSGIVREQGEFDYEPDDRAAPRPARTTALCTTRHITSRSSLMSVACTRSNIFNAGPSATSFQRSSPRVS